MLLKQSMIHWCNLSFKFRLQAEQGEAHDGGPRWEQAVRVHPVRQDVFGAHLAEDAYRQVHR